VGVNYDELSMPLLPGDVYVFCSDGVSEAMNEASQEFTSERLVEVVRRSRQLPAAQIAQNIVAAVAEHRAGFPPNDDVTVVVVRIADA
jgi:sigma-B regulation protein RsbU (phosphoserine phosphatase)